MLGKVNVTPDQPSGLRNLLSIGGTIVGAGVGSLLAPGGGTLAGAQLGAGVGGTAGALGGGVADAQANKNKDFQGGGIPNVEDTAIKRRMDQSSGGAFQSVSDALNVLHTLPGPLRQMYADPLKDAYLKGIQQNGIPGGGR